MRRKMEIVEKVKGNHPNRLYNRFEKIESSNAKGAGASVNDTTLDNAGDSAEAEDLFT